MRDIRLILNEIKSHYDLKSDAEFARFLGIKPQTVSSWYTRNTFDLELLYAKCVNIDANYLLTGSGEMFRSGAANNPNQSILSGENIQIGNNNKVDKRQYYSDSPDVLKAQIEEKDKLLSEKDQRIKEKDAQIKEKDTQIKEKDAQINKLLSILSK